MKPSIWFDKPPVHVGPNGNLFTLPEDLWHSRKFWAVVEATIDLKSKYAGVAPMVEQRFCKPRVPRSSRGSGTSLYDWEIY